MLPVKHLPLLGKCFKSFQIIPIASLKIQVPPTYDDIEFPEQRKLKYMAKTPIQSILQRPKHQKMIHLMKGEETVHNKLQYGQYGVQALEGGRLKFEHMEGIRNFINRRLDESRMFAMWRIEQPWQSITKKAIGVRMGGRKKNIHHFVFPLKSQRIILELGGHLEYEECRDWLEHVARILPFKARAINRDIIEREKKWEAQVVEENLNPFNFMYCARNNFVGIKKEITKHEWETEGKFR